MRLWEKSNIIFDRILSAMAVFAGFLVIFIMLGVCGEVISTVFIGRSLPWMTEIVNYCLLWITFLVAAWVLKNDGHIKMDIVLTRLSIRNTALLDVFTSIIGAIICLVIAWFSARVTWQNFQTGSVIPIYLYVPAAFVNFIIPVGYLLLFIQFLRRIFGNLKSLKRSDNGKQGYMDKSSSKL